MGTNFSALTDGSAKIPSNVGDDAKPMFENDQTSSQPQTNTGTSPEQDKAMWEGMSIFP
jgi:carboxypeptidase D